MSAGDMDRGGLHYRIETAGDFAALDAFLARINQAKAGIETLKKNKTLFTGRGQGGGGQGGSGRRRRGSVGEPLGETAEIERRMRAAKRQAEEFGRAQERIALDARRREERHNRERMREFRRSLQQRISAEQSAQERASLARQRAQQRDDQRRIRELRQNIQQRMQEEIRAERQIARAREQAANRAAIQQQRQQQAQDASRIKSLREDILARTKETADVDRRINRVLGDRVKIEQNLARMQQRGIAVGSLTEQQAVQMGLASRLPGRVSGAVSQQPPQETVSFFDRLKRQLIETDGAANRVSFTFRRLFGILAAFTLARVAIAQFSNLVREMVNFNARLEQAELGIASLLLAAGNLRDPLGGAVTQAERLPMAMAEARRQADLLRRDSLQTAATFEDLIDTFQVALAPGLTANLQVDQIRQLSVTISQAATALGLAQNQLSEEIRSILEGTIQTRTTRIAVALGITNEDIRQAKEAGRLFEFLQDQFAAFAEAGEQMESTFTALFTNLAGAISLVLGAGGIELFERVKDILRDLQGAFVERDPITGILEPVPEAVRGVRQLGDAFASLVEEGQRLMQALSFEDIETFSTSLAATIRGVGLFLGRVIEGIVKGLGDIRSAGQAVAQAIESIPGLDFIDPERLGRVLTLLVRIVTVLTVLRFVTSALVSLLGVRLFTRLAVNLDLWARATTLVTAAKVRLLAVMAAIRGMNFASVIAGITTASRGLVRVLSRLLAVMIPILAFEIGTSLGQNVEPLQRIVLQVLGGIQIAWEHTKSLFLQGIDLIGSAFRGMYRIIANGLATIFDAAAAGFEKIGRTEAASSLRGVANDIRGAVRPGLQNLEEAFESTTERLQGSSNIIRGEFNEILADLRRFAGEEVEPEVVNDFLDRFQQALDTAENRIDNETNSTLRSVLSMQLDQLRKAFEQEMGELENISFAQQRQARIRTRDEAVARIRENIAQTLKELDEGTADFSFDATARVINNIRSLAGAIFNNLPDGDELMGGATESARTLGDLFDALPASINGSRQGLEDLTKLTDQLADDLSRARLELDISRATRNLEGPIQQQRRALLEARDQQREMTEDMTEELERAERQRSNLIENQSRLQSRLNLLTQEQRQEVDAAVESFRRMRDMTRQIADAEGGIQLLELRIEGAEEIGDFSEAERLTEQLDEQRTRLAELKQQHESIQQEIDGQAVSSEKVAELIRQRIGLEGEQAVLAERIRDIEADREKIAEGVNAALELRLRQLSQEAEIESRRRSEDLAIEVNALRQMQATEDSARRKAIQAEKQVQQQELLLDRLRETQSAERVALEQKINFAQSEELRNQLIAQRLQLEKEHNLELDKASLKLKKIEEDEERLKKIAEQPVLMGMVVAFENLQDEMLSAEGKFKNTVKIMTSAIEGFAEVVSQSIVDAFDPTTDESFRERFGRFLQSLAKEIISMLVKVAIAKIALGVAGFFGGGANEGGAVNDLANYNGGQAIGAATGGRTDRLRDKAQGFAKGGRPDGLHPSDTIPIWTAPGEWVIRAKAVAKYGNAVMDRINQGLVDPTALAGLAGVRRSAGVSTPRGIGRATGGPTPSTASSGQQPPQQNTTTVVPAVIADRNSMERLLNGGGNEAMLEFLHDNGFRPQ